MDYNCRLQNLRNNKNESIAEIKKIDKSELEELEEAKRIIEEKYLVLKQKSLSNLDKKVQEVYNYCKLIEKNSTMSSVIFKVITELVSIFEGEHYVLRRLKYHKDKELPSAVYETVMIIPECVFNNIKNPNYVSERYVHHLLKNNLAIKIIDDWSVSHIPDEFSFYKTDDMSRINPQISFKGFLYVKEFLDYIINYRIENNIDDLEEKEMKKLKEKFILLNVDTIHNNYQSKAEKRMKENAEYISSECEHKQKILKRIVKKIEEN